MKLQDTLPQGVTVDGRFYKLDFDFRNVLRMMDVLKRNDLIPGAKDYLALKCLTKHPRNVAHVLFAVKCLLFDKPPEKDQKKVTSFEQDAALIRSAFRQEYGIDLFRDKLHWVEFSELLQNLPEGNRYSEVLGIRVRPMPSPTRYNAKEREWLMKAKQAVALRLSDEEQAEKYAIEVGAIFTGLMGMIRAAEEQKKGGGNDG